MGENHRELEPAPPASRSLEERAEAELRRQIAENGGIPLGDTFQPEQYRFYQGALWGLRQGEEERNALIAAKNFNWSLLDAARDANAKLKGELDQWEGSCSRLFSENAALSTRLAETEKALEKIATGSGVNNVEDCPDLARKALSLMKKETK